VKEWTVFFLVGFEVLTAVTIKSVNFRDVIPCSLIRTVSVFRNKE
jgi:hypothetical protein